MKIACVVGTRPEAIKMAPVIHELKRRAAVDTIVVLTGQHRELARQALGWFDISIDHDLDVMQAEQGLCELSARLFSAFGTLWSDVSPDMAIVQGDTTSALVAAMSGFYRHIPIAHVEAGLRTYDVQNPFPEEMNRTQISKIAAVHFAPTEKSRDNLLGEGVPREDVHITGNTVIDALNHMTTRQKTIPLPLDSRRKLVLVSIHRRENIGTPLINICGALRALHETCPDTEFVLPVHPNPNIFGPVRALLSNLERFHLVEPLEYPVLVALIRRSRFLLTDSGGLQEEGSACGKPILVLRKETERSEIIASGIGKLVGSDRRRIIAEAIRLLNDDGHLFAMARGGSPFGDGRAAPRIVDHCLAYLGRADFQPAKRLGFN